MGAALGTGARLALLPGRACSAVRHWEPPAPARGCHSKAGPARPVPLKKRGYDVTRNPHLNKVKVREGRMARSHYSAARGMGAPPPGPGEDPSRGPSSGFTFLPWGGLVQLGLAFLPHLFCVERGNQYCRKPNFFRKNKYRLG